MTPGARAQTAIEILGLIAAGNRPADAIVNDFLRPRRYVGAGDRLAITRLVYGVLRRRAQLDWWLARAGFQGEPAPRERVLALLLLGETGLREDPKELFDGDRFRPAPLSAEEEGIAGRLSGHSLDHPQQPAWVRSNVPEWLWPDLARRFGANAVPELAALLEEAPVDLRVNRLKGSREKAHGLLKKEGIEARPTPLSPLGLRLRGRAPLVGAAAFQGGLIEFQDEGSQLASLLVAAKPGMRVVDLCAGAGGKTLALAAEMANKGHIVACDVSAKRLDAAAKRLRRAGAFNVECRPLKDERDPWIKRHAQGFDRVLVDAPCTGTGTWRRNPQGRWTLSREELDRLVDLQARILEAAARLVKPGGRVVYVTCSFLLPENEGQIDGFVARHPDFAVLPLPGVWEEAIDTPVPSREPYLRLTPAEHGTDGFFIAVLARQVD